MYHMNESATRLQGRLRERTAEEIRVVLARRRMSAAELARRAGIKQSTMARRMTGETAFDLDDLECIAEVLEVSVVDLIPREVRPNAGSVRVAEWTTPKRVTTRASVVRPVSCSPAVRSSSDQGMLRRPRVRQSPTHPIAA